VAGEGFVILPTVTTTFPTYGLLIELKALEKVTLFPLTEQEKLLMATESTTMDMQAAFKGRAYTFGKMRMTEAFGETLILRFLRVRSYSLLDCTHCLAFYRRGRYCL
jgi:hypothetical protein